MSQSLEPVSGGADSRKVVTTAGTPVQLDSTDNPCRWVIVTAETDNTGYIALGFSNVVRATPGVQVGTILAPGEKIVIPINHVGGLWLDASVSGEGVAYSVGG